MKKPQPIRFDTIEEAAAYIIDANMVGTLSTVYESGYYQAVTGLAKGFYIFGSGSKPLTK